MHQNVKQIDSVKDDGFDPYTQVVYELATGNQWSFDVQWCPRNPAVISASSFDGHISVYSLMGGGVSTQTSSKV